MLQHHVSVFVGVLIASLPALAHADPGAGVFRAAPEAPVLRDAPAIREVPLTLASRELDDAVVGDLWTFNLMEDVSLAGFIERVDRVGDVLTVTGDVLSDDGAVAVGTFVASVVDEAMTMAAWLDDGRVFEVRPAPGGVLVARELDSPAFPTCATGPEQAVDAGPVRQAIGSSQRGVCTDDGSVLDVLVVYTPSARSRTGGTNGIQSLINNAVAAANNSYTNSDIPTRLNLVHTAEVDYAESTFSTDLSRLRATSDGVMDEVHALRDQYDADFVALINDGSGSCGIGYLMTSLSVGFRSSAFTVTDYSCAVGNLTFAHEIGHNSGCAHDRDNSSSGLYSYSFGHRWISSDNNRQYRSVMSYSPGTRVPHFSNPDIDYRGTATGIASGSSSADNARSMTNALSTLALFRDSGAGPRFTSSPVSVTVDAGEDVTFSVNASGDALTYRWYRDGELVSDGGRFSGASTPSLTIEQVEVADAGAYTAGAENFCGEVVSNPGVLTVTLPCPADLTDNDQLDFFDVASFIALYNAQDPLADFAEPFGLLNFFDVSAYMAAYNAGCP